MGNPINHLRLSIPIPKKRRKKQCLNQCPIRQSRSWQLCTRFPSLYPIREKRISLLIDSKREERSGTSWVNLFNRSIFRRSGKYWGEPICVCKRTTISLGLICLFLYTILLILFLRTPIQSESIPYPGHMSELEQSGMYSISQPIQPIIFSYFLPTAYCYSEIFD